MHKSFLLTAALLGAVAVMLGAFGAHRLQVIAAPRDVETFRTGVQYQVYHVLALIATGLLYEKGNKKLLSLSGYFFISGILLFSGSLYVITLLKVMESNTAGWLVYLTPIGGLCMIAGWCLMLFGILKSPVVKAEG